MVFGAEGVDVDGMVCSDGVRADGVVGTDGVRVSLSFVSYHCNVFSCVIGF